jgi:DNA-binding transcriptional regulator GbsR (MarR family)
VRFLSLADVQDSNNSGNSAVGELKMETNEQGYLSGFTSAFKDGDKNVSMAVRDLEYLQFEMDTAKSEGNQDAFEALNRVLAYRRAKLPKMMRDLPAKRVSIAKAVKALSKDDQKKIQELIAAMVASNPPVETPAEVPAAAPAEPAAPVA